MSSPQLALLQQPTVEKESPAAPTDKFEAARYALSAVNSQLFYKETGRVIWNILSGKIQTYQQPA